MDKTHPLSTPMIVRSLNVKNDIFRPCEDNEEVIGLDVLVSSNSQLVGYADVGYLSNPHKTIFQIDYLYSQSSFSSSSSSSPPPLPTLDVNSHPSLSTLELETIAATSSNHVEIIAIHEASLECVWLRSMSQRFRETCDLSSHKESLTIIYEDNIVCKAQLHEGYIKQDRTTHISPKFFFTRDLCK